MKVLYPSHTKIPNESAVSIQITGMCEAIRKLGHEVLLFARRGDLDVDVSDYYDLEEPVEILLNDRDQSRLPGTAGFYAELLWDVYGSFDPDLIYGRHLKSLVALAFTGKPIVYERHWRMEGALEKFLLRLLFSFSNFRRLIVTTGVLKDHFLDEFPRLEDRVTIAHMAEHESVARTDYGSDDHALPGDESRFKAGYVGGLNPSVDWMIRMAEQCSWADFHVFGGDADWKIEFWEDRGEHLDNFYMHGFVKPAELRHYTTQLDVGLAPYRLKEIVRTDDGPAVRDEDPALEPEFSSVKLIEYMALGQACICSDFRAFAEVIDDGENGVLRPPEDLTAWVEALERLRDDPDLKQFIEENARRTFLEHYTWEKRAKKCFDSLRA